MPRRLTSFAAAALTVALTAPHLAAAQTTTAKATTQSAAPKAVQPGTPAAAAPPASAVSAAPTAARVVPHGDLVETAKASGQFTTFLKAADATNLTAILKNNQNLTVFAPTDAAFAALPAGELDKLMADKPALQKLLTHHIINARVDSSKIKGAKGPVPSVAGDPIELDGSGEVLKADNADIVQADVMASNGILQVVDKVLTPGAATAANASASGAAASTTTTTTTHPDTTAAQAKPPGK